MPKRQTEAGAAVPSRSFDQHDEPGRVDLSAFYPIGSHFSGTDISSALGLISPPLSTKLLIQTLDQNARFTLEGTAPTAASGFQLVAGDPPLLIMITENVTVTVIEEAATASIEYQWGN